MKRGRIRLYFEGESRDAEIAAARTEAAIASVDDATKHYNKTAGEQQVAIEKVNRRNFELVSSTKAVNRESESLSKRLQDVNIHFTSMRNLVSLIKWPALISGAGYAAEGIGALGAGATGLVSALAPLSGALAAYPALLGGVGQAAGVLALTQMSDLKQALEGNEDALKRLSPQAKNLLDVIKGLEPEFKRLRSSVQGKLFDGLTAGLKSARGNFDVVRRVLGATASAMGNLARRAGELVGGKGFGRDLERVGKGNATVLERMGLAGLKLTSALRHVMVAAQPFLGWLSGSAIKLADWVDGAAKAGRESGQLHGFFNKTREVMERLASITGSLVSGLLNIGHAAAPLGREILAALDDAAQGFSDWTDSVKGKNVLKEYFADAKPAIFEMGRLVRDVAGVFLELSASSGVAPLTRQIRTELVPVIKEVLEGATNAFGPHLVEALVQVAKLFGDIAGPSGPLTLFVTSLGHAAEFANTLLENVPGLNSVVLTLAGTMGVAKAMKWTAAITGVSTLIDLFKKLKDAAIGAKLAEEGASAPGFVGGLRSGKGGGIKGKLGGLLGLGATAATTVGPAGMLSGAEVAGMGGAEGAGGLLAAAPAVAPWLAIAAAVAAVAAGLVLLYKNSKTFRDIVKPVTDAAVSGFGEIKKSFGPLGDALKNLGSEFSGKGELGKNLAAFGRMVKPWVTVVAGLFKNILVGDVKGAIAGIAAILRGFTGVLSGLIQGWRGVIEVFTGILTLKFGKAWNGVKNIFGGGIKAVLGVLQVATAPFKAIIVAVGSAMSSTFSGVWGRVTGIFEDGVNAAIGFIDTLLEAINAIPGLPDIGLIDTVGGAPHGSTKKEKKEALHHQHRYTGGPITRPMAIVGEEAPQHHEWVIATNPRYRESNIGYWMQAGRDLGIPGFLSGGDIAGAVGGAVSSAASTVGGAVSNVVGKGASFFLDKLPTPHLPKWLMGLGSYAISHVADYIKNGFKDEKLGSLIGSVGGKGLTTIEGHPVADWIARILFAARKAGVAFSVSSGYRSYAEQKRIYDSGVRPAAVPGTSHHEGTAYPDGAVDISPGAGSLAAWLAHSRWRKALIYAGAKDPVHFSHPYGGGYAKGGLVQFFAKGGKYSPSDIKRSGTLTPDEWAIAMLLGGFPAKPGVIAAGLGTIKSESNFNASSQVPGNEHIGGWALSRAFGSTAARLDPIHASAAAFQEWKKDGGFWQAWGQWEAEQSGLGGGGAGAYGPEFMSVAERVLKGAGSTVGKSKPKNYKFGVGQHNTAVSLPGLAPGQVPAAAAGLPTQIRELFKQPGLSFASKVGIAEYAASMASNTRQPTYDAEGFETSADSGEDDRAAARLQKELAETNKRRLEKRLREIKERLQKKGLSQQQRNKLLAEQAQVAGNLTATRQSIAGFNATINAGPEAPETPPPTALDYANRDLALAELTPDIGDDQAARQKILQIAEAAFTAARATADPRDDIEAAQNLKAAREALEAVNETLKQREEFEKERLEMDKRLVSLAETQGPAFMSAFVAWVDGAIGGPITRRSTLAGTAGVPAAYQG